MKTTVTTPAVAQPESEAMPRIGGGKLPWHRARATVLGLLVPLLALLVSFGIGAILLVLSGANPVEAYRALVQGAFGSQHNIFETLVKMTPILLVALGVTFAFRCSTWNIGAEGQLHLGAVGATVAGLALKGLAPDLPGIISIPVLLLAGFLAGGLYASFAGILKVKWEVNEVITTIMMNFVAILFVQYLAFGPLRDPTAGGLPMSPYIIESGQLPRLVAQSRLHLGVVIALIAAVVVYIVLWKTTLGFQIRAVGANPRAARHAGIDVSRSVFIAMVISGGLAGLAGMIEIAGLHYRLLDSFSPGYGSIGIVVALLGNLHPLLIVPAALLFGGLLNGADTMARTMQVSTSIITVIQGLMVLFVLGSQFLVARWEE
ncbi:MAG: ABC transporter permease [Ardenticatenaceae bacterium]|nr:ABC transporter permease [Ardenticatenaceae bacterium]